MTKKCNSTHELKQKVHQIIQTCWQAQAYSKETIDAFYTDVEKHFERELYNYRSGMVGQRAVYRFITYINQSRKAADKLPMPSYFESIARASLSFDQLYLHKGKALVPLVEAVIAHWSETSDYSTEEKLGWLIFSVIFFGGINHKPVLCAYIKQLLENGFKADASFDWSTCVSVTYASSSYGNDYGANGRLFATQQIVIDNVSRLWLVELQKEPAVLLSDKGADKDERKIETYLSIALRSIQTEKPSTHYSFSFLC